MKCWGKESDGSTKVNQKGSKVVGGRIKGPPRGASRGVRHEKNERRKPPSVTPQEQSPKKTSPLLAMGIQGRGKYHLERVNRLMFGSPEFGGGRIII